MARLVIAENNNYVVDSTYVDPNGEYEIVRIKDDAGKNEVACFMSDKSRRQNFNKGDGIRINHISRIGLGWKKKKRYDKQSGGYVERWEQEFTITVDATKTASDLDGAADWIDEVEGAELPWTDGELPL